MNTDLLQKLHDANPVRQALLSLEALGIEIFDFREALVRCPGQDFHTTANRDRDCKVINHPMGPYLKCFHSSCSEVIAQLNTLLNSRVTGPPAFIGHNPGRLTHRQTTAPNQSRIADIIKAHPWDYNAIEAACPVESFRLEIQYHAPALLLLFHATDNVWIGRDVYDSGKPGHIWRFREAQSWMRWSETPGIYTCPSTFHPGTISRSKPGTKDRRFLVVESDLLNRDQVGSVFQWMIAQGHRLRAVVDTAGKSLHGWFDFPGEDQLPQLKWDLTELGCDPAMFGASQPCRLPGALRPETQRFQKLIYIHA